MIRNFIEAKKRHFHFWADTAKLGEKRHIFLTRNFQIAIQLQLESKMKRFIGINIS